MKANILTSRQLSYRAVQITDDNMMDVLNWIKSHSSTPAIISEFQGHNYIDLDDSELAVGDWVCVENNYAFGLSDHVINTLFTVK